MEAKKITQQQMEALFAFTRKHYVEYYDLQAELADHLANAIEERWQAEPGLTFDEALQLEFKKFGIFGFSDIVAERQYALQKRYYRLVWKEFRSVLTFPVILFITGLAWGMYHSIMAYHHSYAFFMFLLIVVSSWKLWRLKKEYHKRRKETGRKWLFEEILFSCGGFGVIMPVPLQLSHFMFDEGISQMLAAIVSVLLALFFVYDYMVLFRMPARAERYLQKVYPEYGLEKTA